MSRFKISDNQTIQMHTGMLPNTDPTCEFPLGFTPYHQLALNIPKLLRQGSLRIHLNALDAHHQGLEAFLLKATPEQLQRSYSVLATLRQAYAYEYSNSAQSNADHTLVTLPPHFLKTLSFVADKIGIKPTQTYYSYIIQNWRRIDKSKDITLNNIEPILTFTDTPDEKGFIKLHVVCEALAGKALVHALMIDQFLCGVGSRALGLDEINMIIHGLNEMADSINAVANTLPKLLHICDPDVYADTVRPMLMPQEYFRGASGVQTCIFAILDRFMGINTEALDMQDYRTAQTRALIHRFDPKRLVNKLQQMKNQDLIKAYHGVIEAIGLFRKNHLKYIVQYYNKPFAANMQGTGLTSSDEFLKSNIACTFAARGGLCVPQFHAQTTNPGQEQQAANNDAYGAPYTCPVSKL